LKLKNSKLMRDIISLRRESTRNAPILARV